MTPYGLRVEHLDHPLGMHTVAPRLSWRLDDRQRAYRIRTGNGWDTGKVADERSLLVAYDGPVLRSAERVTWQVKVWTDGIYEAFLNGERVGDAELTPGFTQYDSRLQVQTYDIGELVRDGENVLAIVLSDGWWCGQTGALRATQQWGTGVAVLAQLNDGVTGPWKCARGHLTSADLIAGQRVDLRALPVGWTEPGFDDSGWHDALVAGHGYDKLVDSPAPPVRRVERSCRWRSPGRAPDGRSSTSGRTSTAGSG